MSLTLGFAVKKTEVLNRDLLQSDLINGVKKYGYGISFDVRSAVDHVQSGLQCLVDAWCIDFIAIIHAPNNGLAEASEISGDLIEGGNRECALGFFSTMCSLFDRHTNSFSVFFAVEDWDDEMKIRIKSGSEDDFFKYISRPSGWWEEYYLPKSNVITCDDSKPFVFSICK